jgi:hypothetical protein
VNTDIWQAQVRNLMNTVSGPVGAAGMDLWLGLSLIMLVWTGTQIALSGGGFNMAAVVRLVMVLAIPRGILEFYVRPLPGTSMNVPGIITGMGSWLQGIIVSDSFEGMYQALVVMGEQTWRNLMTALGQGSGGWLDMVPAILSLVPTLFIGLPMQILLSVALFLVFALGQAQVIWANFAVSLAIVLGPIFIPFFVIPPLSFLFWGWFRTLVTYSLYAAVAAAVFRLTTEVGVTVMTRIVQPSSYGSAEGLATLWQNTYLGLFYVVAALLASLKIGEFVQMLLSGAGTVSSGLGSRAAQGVRLAAGGV